MSACRADDDANVRRAAREFASCSAKGQLGEGESVLERVDDGDPTTLASTPADEGFEADETSRNMAFAGQEKISSRACARRRGIHDEEWVEDDERVVGHDGQTPAFAECKRIQLIGRRYWRGLIGRHLCGPTSRPCSPKSVVAADSCSTYHHWVHESGSHRESEGRKYYTMADTYDTLLVIQYVRNNKPGESKQGAKRAATKTPTRGHTPS